jgi:hypothetical protein
MVTNEYNLEAIRPHLNPDSLTEIIPLGHDTTYFEKWRKGGVGEPVKVAYTTWKSEVGDETASLLANDPAFEFRAIRGTAGWEELRELYHWADVFLCTPLYAEGFYLPGLEAMAAGAIVVTPDAYGNRAYCRFGENCVLVEHSDPRSYADALRDIASWDTGSVDEMRRHGYEAAARHTWEAEERRFAAFLERLVDRLERRGPPRRLGPAEFEAKERRLAHASRELETAKQRNASLVRELQAEKTQNASLRRELDEVKASGTYAVVSRASKLRGRLPRLRPK